MITSKRERVVRSVNYPYLNKWNTYPDTKRFNYSYDTSVDISRVYQTEGVLVTRHWVLTCSESIRSDQKFIITVNRSTFTYC